MYSPRLAAGIPTMVLAGCRKRFAQARHTSAAAETAPGCPSSGGIPIQTGPPPPRIATRALYNPASAEMAMVCACEFASGKRPGLISPGIVDRRLHLFLGAHHPLVSRRHGDRRMNIFQADKLNLQSEAEPVRFRLHSLFQRVGDRLAIFGHEMKAFVNRRDLRQFSVRRCFLSAESASVVVFR